MIRTPKINLRKLNRLLRWTGWRLSIDHDISRRKDTKLYFGWYGWKFLFNLKRDLQKDESRR
jgi:hypothetical protein